LKTGKHPSIARAGYVPLFDISRGGIECELRTSIWAIAPMASTRRRLTAILAADVVGYSRLMRADEEGTHERFKAHRRELVDPEIHQHHGRIVKFTGDGMLVEFSSVVEAVLCAIATPMSPSNIASSSA
jgi:class 3 adenylate cyclase